MRRGITVVAVAASLMAGGSMTSAVAAPAGGLAETACNAAGKQVLISGKPAQVFCVPASATVEVGGRTIRFRKGTCVWTTNSFKLELGTLFLAWSKPFPAQFGFAIRATGVPVARALVEIYWQGTRTILSTTRTTARPNSTSTGGTFEGRTATGARVTGTVKCG